MYNFIVNPHSRSGLGQSVWNELDAILKENNIDYKVFFTEHAKHATEITKGITSDGEEHTIIALGGDGTVNEIVNGITDFEKVIFGYIPIGSSNDFARGMKLPKKPKKALQTILDCAHLHPMNVGELRYKNKLRHFAVSCGLGFDADIVHESAVSRMKYIFNKIGLGKLIYVWIAIHRLFITKPCTVDVELDGKSQSFPRTYFVALMNNRYEGGGVKFTPNAQNDDDELDICMVGNMCKLKALMLFPLAFAGLHVHFKGVHILRGKQIHIQSENPLPLHTDGEAFFLQREIFANCADKKLRVITNQEL